MVHGPSLLVTNRNHRFRKSLLSITLVNSASRKITLSGNYNCINLICSTGIKHGNFHHTFFSPSRAQNVLACETKQTLISGLCLQSQPCWPGVGYGLFSQCQRVLRPAHLHCGRTCSNGQEVKTAAQVEAGRVYATSRASKMQRVTKTLHYLKNFKQHYILFNAQC